MTTRIQDAFDIAKSENRAAFIGYLPAGYPSKELFLEHARVLLESVDLLEIGLPYSDPLGDGPTIQRASEVALLGGMTVQGVFEQAAALRETTNKPLMVMTYYNPILATGEEVFVSSALKAGIDGLILPDLPPDEAETLIPLAKEAGLKLTFLLAPTSTEDRIQLIAKESTGFIYAVSVTGITGARAAVPTEVPELVAKIKAVTDKPVAVGFGIADKATANGIAQVADGVVVGSVLVTIAGRGESLREKALEILEGCKR